jgi:hypothetical protein
MQAGLVIGTLAVAWVALASGQPDEPQAVVLGTRWRTDDIKDLATLLASSETVFAGTVSELSGQRLEELSPPAAAAPAGDADKPPAKRVTSLPISVFDVRVEEVWKGTLDASDIVIVEQAGGTVRSSDGAETRILLEGDEPIVIGETYLFWFGSTSGDRFVTSPFRRLEVSDSGRFDAMAGWRNLGALRALSGLRAADLDRAIAEAGR